MCVNCRVRMAKDFIFGWMSRLTSCNEIVTKIKQKQQKYFEGTQEDFHSAQSSTFSSNK